MSKRGIILCAPDVLAGGGLSPLADHGISVVRSLDSGEVDLVRLVIEGEALPADCALPGPLLELRIEFTAEYYGRQSIVRVSGITVDRPI